MLLAAVAAAALAFPLHARAVLAASDALIAGIFALASIIVSALVAPTALLVIKRKTDVSVQSVTEECLALRAELVTTTRRAERAEHRADRAEHRLDDTLDTLEWLFERNAHLEALVGAPPSPAPGALIRARRARAAAMEDHDTENEYPDNGEGHR